MFFFLHQSHWTNRDLILERFPLQGLFSITQTNKKPESWRTKTWRSNPKKSGSWSDEARRKSMLFAKHVEPSLDFLWRFKTCKQFTHGNFMIPSFWDPTCGAFHVSKTPVLDFFLGSQVIPQVPIQCQPPKKLCIKIFDFERIQLTFFHIPTNRIE